MALTQTDILWIKARYEEGLSSFEQLASAVHEALADVVTRRQVRHMVAHRAKGPGSLERKLLKARDSYSPEQFTDTLSPPLKDLAAARVLLYLDEDVEPVVSSIEKKFETQGHQVTRSHAKTDSGYDAYHLHVDCRGRALRAGKWLPNTVFEVQVCTITQHVWNELEHDIIYKQPSGEPDAAQVELLAALLGELRLATGTASRLMQHTNTLIARNTSAIRDSETLNFYLRSRVGGKYLHGDIESLFKFLQAALDPLNQATIHTFFVNGLSEARACELLKKHDAYENFRDVGRIAIQLLPNIPFSHVKVVVDLYDDAPPLFKFILRLAEIMHNSEVET